MAEITVNQAQVPPENNAPPPTQKVENQAAPAQNPEIIKPPETPKAPENKLVSPQDADNQGQLARGTVEKKNAAATSKLNQLAAITV